MRCSLLPVLFLAIPALAQPDPSGIDFVTVGAPNNPACHGPDPEHRVTGRGSVPNEFRLIPIPNGFQAWDRRGFGLRGRAIRRPRNFVRLI